MVMGTGTNETAKYLLGSTIPLSNDQHLTCSSDSEGQLNINNLPDEILIQILSQLDPVVLNNLRLVCKKWNHVINDKETWMKSFQTRFGILPTSSSFPSVTNGTNWMNEYFTRLEIMRTWKRGTSVHQVYQLLSNEHKFNDETMCDFKMKKICIFDKRSGNICSGNLINGRNQSFIPGGYDMDVLCYSMNWNYLVLGKSNGDIVLKNLATSTTSYSHRVSLIKFQVSSEGDTTEGFELSPILSILINDFVDKTGAHTDVISGSYNGTLQAWNIHGKKKNEAKLDGTILNIKSDFSKYIVVNTVYSVYVLDFHTLAVINRVEIGFSIINDEEEEREHLVNLKNELDVDFAGRNIILSHKSTVQVFRFEGSGTKTLKLSNGVRIVCSQFQECLRNKLIYSNNFNIIGHDGLLYGHLLSDSSIIVWNVRDHTGFSSITPQMRIYPEMNYRKISASIDNVIMRNDLMSVTSFALNGCVLAVSGYNGVTNIYDVFTGKLIREAGVKFPKRFSHFHNTLQKTDFIKLNPNQLESNGVIVCGDTVQYFQFGDLVEQRQSKNLTVGKKPKHLNLGTHSKNESKKKIRDGIDEYNRQIYKECKTDELFDKYNGTSFDNEEEEMRVALAMSESENLQSNKSSSIQFETNNDGDVDDLDENLQIALQLSKIEANENEINCERQKEPSSLDDEDLRAAIERSLIEH
ncbi:hypothetical protein KGF56_000865 [Candida oxycetoniae]|uniref:F-box domain-containing protein n=1 Tax=Candida oxycetoniae TaxID=497107 RepID=A0AAI9WZT3_9ASCO|nr:uncharacterized protein KGF56_000865 [Candida oxycetoniae]KAI3406384.2 hypothetical protein KGF56_000865 [Candida oxycetoniae]